MAGMAAAGGWAFCVTYALCWLMNKVPGLHLRLGREHEELGIDATEMGEYAFDYIESLSNSQEWGFYSPKSKTTATAAAVEASHAAGNGQAPDVVVQGIELAAAQDGLIGSTPGRPTF